MIIGIIAICIIVLLAILQTIYYGGLIVVDRTFHKFNKRAPTYKSSDEMDRIIADHEAFARERIR